jgi:NAD(P)-dependent dehydrogenase (short-subunit alcohol dehydrogenase family)
MPPKTILITGATDGIGHATAVELARRGFRIILHGRDRARLERSLQDVIEAGTSNLHHVVEADLSSLEHVAAMTGGLIATGEPIHVLINNAGVYMTEKKLTRDGFETTFAVNHLSHFLLTLDLLDLLRYGSPARIINVSSVAHRRGRLDFDDLHASDGYGGYEAYARSKAANVLFTRSLSTRLDPGEISANALHPGVISTKLLRAGFTMAGGSVEKGAETSVYLASSPEVEGVSGRYFGDSAERQAADHAMDVNTAERLWAASVEMIRSVLPSWSPAV